MTYAVGPEWSGSDHVRGPHIVLRIYANHIH